MSATNLTRCISNTVAGAMVYLSHQHRRNLVIIASLVVLLPGLGCDRLTAGRTAQPTASGPTTQSSPAFAQAGATSPSGSIVATPPTVVPSATVPPRSPTPLPGEKLYLNEKDTLAFTPPPSNSESHIQCLFSCTLTWSITLTQPLQGNAYGYALLGSGENIRILHTHNGKQVILAEWKNRIVSSGQMAGLELNALPGDMITLEVYDLLGSFQVWNYGKNSSITIGKTARPLPTETPRPCYQAAAVGDQIYRLEHGAGRTWTFTFNVRNTGSCTWDTGYHLVFYEGDQMSAPDSINFPRTTPPNDYEQLQIKITAPSKPGTYEGRWLLEAPGGTRFGFGPDGMTPFVGSIIVDP